MQKYSGLDAKEMKIRIEPGLFQWMHWCKHGLPPFMNAEQFNRAGFSIDLSYKAIDDAAKFDEKETLLDYYNRSFALVRGILDSHPEGELICRLSFRILSFRFECNFDFMFHLPVAS